MRLVLVDVVLHLRFKFFEKIHHPRSLSLRSKIALLSIVFIKNLNKFQSTNEFFEKIHHPRSLSLRSKIARLSIVFIKKFKQISIKKGPRIIEGLFSIIGKYYFFFFSSRPNGRLFAKSTNTGAATKIEE